MTFLTQKQSIQSFNPPPSIKEDGTILIIYFFCPNHCFNPPPSIKEDGTPLVARLGGNRVFQSTTLY